MNYITASYENSTKAYTFKTEDEVIKGDKVETTDGKHLTVIGKADMEFVDKFGADKIKEVKLVKAESEE